MKLLCLLLATLLPIAGGTSLALAPTVQSAPDHVWLFQGDRFISQADSVCWCAGMLQPGEAMVYARSRVLHRRRPDTKKA